MATIISPKSDVQILVMTDVSDVEAVMGVTFRCFGQGPDYDGILHALNPSWDTPDGQVKALERWTKRFNSEKTYTANGDPIKTYLKAVATDAEGNQRIVGYAVWLQISVVEGYGEEPLVDPRKSMPLEELYPGDPSEQEYLCVMLQSLNEQRNELAEKQKSASPPAIMALDLCVVHPDFQRRGIASRMVQWGLDEAKRRGGLVCCLEASKQGRPVYAKLGFKPEGPEIDYRVNGAKFAEKGMPPNQFMRTEG